MGTSGGQAGPHIVLSAITVAENASVGDLVGTLSVALGSGSYTFTMDVNAEFELDAVDTSRVEVKGVLTPGTYNVTVQAVGGDPELEQTFQVTVTEVSGTAGEPIGLLLILTKAA
jgi:hypothetical protein